MSKLTNGQIDVCVANISAKSILVFLKTYVVCSDREHSADVDLTSFCYRDVFV